MNSNDSHAVVHLAHGDTMDTLYFFQHGDTPDEEATWFSAMQQDVFGDNKLSACSIASSSGYCPAPASVSSPPTEAEAEEGRPQSYHEWGSAVFEDSDPIELQDDDDMFDMLAESFQCHRPLPAATVIRTDSEGKGDICLDKIARLEQVPRDDDEASRPIVVGYFSYSSYVDPNDPSVQLLASSAGVAAAASTGIAPAIELDTSRQIIDGFEFFDYAEEGFAPSASKAKNQKVSKTKKPADKRNAPTKKQPEHKSSVKSRAGRSSNNFASIAEPESLAEDSKVKLPKKAAKRQSKSTMAKLHSENNKSKMAKSMQQGVNKKKVPNSVAAAKKTACEEKQKKTLIETAVSVFELIGGMYQDPLQTPDIVLPIKELHRRTGTERRRLLDVLHVLEGLSLVHDRTKANVIFTGSFYRDWRTAANKQDRVGELQAELSLLKAQDEKLDMDIALAVSKLNTDIALATSSSTSH